MRLKPEVSLALMPDPRRWDLKRLARGGAEEDRVLAEQGLAEWADTLDEEDHR